jgi:membrane-bound serine protease (ClpP class)
MRSRDRPLAIGGTDMVGLVTTMRSPASVFVEGELWSARPAADAPTPEKGQRVRVVGREGMTLIVEPLSAAETPPTEDPSEDTNHNKES